MMNSKAAIYQKTCKIIKGYEQQIAKVAEKAQHKNKKYIFRGEPKNYGRCDSSLYRKAKGGKANKYVLYKDQKGIIEGAREHVDTNNDIDILAKVRHHVGSPIMLPVIKWRLSGFHSHKRTGATRPVNHGVSAHYTGSSIAQSLA